MKLWFAALFTFIGLLNSLEATDARAMKNDPNAPRFVMSSIYRGQPVPLLEAGTHPKRGCHYHHHKGKMKMHCGSHREASKKKRMK